MFIFELVCMIFLTLIGKFIYESNFPDDKGTDYLSFFVSIGYLIKVISNIIFENKC